MVCDFDVLGPTLEKRHSRSAAVKSLVSRLYVMLINSNFSRFKPYAWRYLRYMRPRRVCSGLREKSARSATRSKARGLPRVLHHMTEAMTRLKCRRNFRGGVGFGVGAHGIFGTAPFAACNPPTTRTLGSASGNLSDEDLPINFGQASPTD